MVCYFQFYSMYSDVFVFFSLFIMGKYFVYLCIKGVFGCFVEVKSDDKSVADFYKKLGFKELHANFLGRTF